MTRLFTVNFDLNLICPNCEIEMVNRKKENVKGSFRCPRCFVLANVDTDQVREVLREIEEKLRDERNKMDFKFKIPKWCRFKK